jgi:hypothetical protein
LNDLNSLNVLNQFYRSNRSKGFKPLRRLMFPVWLDFHSDPGFPSFVMR